MASNKAEFTYDLDGGAHWLQKKTPRQHKQPWTALADVIDGSTRAVKAARNVAGVRSMYYMMMHGAITSRQQLGIRRCLYTNADANDARFIWDAV